MNSHKHARLTPKGRALLVSRVLDEGWTVADASLAAGVSQRTSYKWLARFRAEGELGLLDRSSRPRRCPRGLSADEQGSLEALRRQRWPLWRIAMQAGRGVATVSRCMKRLGLSRLASLEPPVPVLRYERAAAGELLHIDTKKLGRDIDDAQGANVLHADLDAQHGHLRHSDNGRDPLPTPVPSLHRSTSICTAFDRFV